MKTYPAIQVASAALWTFSERGNTEYAKQKTSSFLKQCGADINKPKVQPLDVDRIREVAYSMFDADAEQHNRMERKPGGQNHR